MTSQILNQWINWSPEVLQTPFNSKEPGVGPGEDRAAEMFGTVVLGPSSPFDMTATINGILYSMIEVKKLDGREFAMHKLVTDLLKPIQSNIASFISYIPSLLTYQDILKDDICLKLTELMHLVQDEVSDGNLKRLVKVFNDLNLVKQALIPFQTLFECVDSFGKNINAPASQYLRKLRSDDCTPEFIEEKMGMTQYKIATLVVDYLSHPFIDAPNKMMNDLNGLTLIFKDILMVFVTEGGYYIMTEAHTKIIFSRITRGCKFKLLERI
jgi:hypothetical protein